MQEIGSFDAKTHLPALLARVEKGEEFIITRHGKPVAKLLPPLALTPPRLSKKEAKKVADKFRALAKTMDGKFDWEEWKAYRDEGKK